MQKMNWINRAVALLVVTGLVWAGAPELRLKSRLAGASVQGLEPSGSTEFRARGTRSSFHAEVEDVNLAAGTQVTVSYVRGGMKTAVGSITISAAPIRGGELELNTQDGDSVPTLRKGDMIVVDAPTGVILAGVL